MFMLYSCDFISKQLIYRYSGGLLKRIQRCLFVFFIVFVFVRGGSDAQRIPEALCPSIGGVDSPCVNILQCRVLLKLLRRRPILPEIAERLRQSQCGFDGEKPKVCCPPNPLLPNLSECGEVDFPNKIVGGRVTDLHEYPWMALLEYTEPTGKGFHCGGSLISDRYVLTAAHCVRNSNLNSRIRLTGVRLGEWNISSVNDCIGNTCSSPPVDVPIETSLVHENYNMSDPSQPYDIALLRLAFPVTYTDYIKPACLPVISQFVSTLSLVGKELTVAGWGNTENGRESNVKLSVEVPGVSLSQCQAMYKSLGASITPAQTCAGGVEGRDSCRGDSGGPLMVEAGENFFVVGISSFGPNPCGTQGWPGVYTNVAWYNTWISENVLP